jgi:hypothetical protein
MRFRLTTQRLYLAGLVLLALLSAALRSRPGYVLAVGDVFFIEPRPAVVLERDPYLWADTNGGVPSTNAVQLPYRLWWALAGALGMPAWLFQTIERGVFLAGAGLAMYALARAVWPGRQWAPVLASAAYTFNVGRLLIELIVHLEWLYVLLPVLLALYLGMLRQLAEGAVRPALRRGVALAGLVGVTFSVVLINLPQAIVIAFTFCVGVGAALLLAPRAARRRYVAVHAGVAGLTVLLSAWWLWPTFQYYVLSLPESGVAAVTDTLAWSWTQARASFLNELLLIPLWSWNEEYIAVIHVYEQPLMRGLLMLPALAAAGAFWAARDGTERRVSLLLYAGLLLLLFVGKGFHAPGAYVNQLAYENVPGMWLLREPWGKIFAFVAVSIALLAGAALDELVTRLSSAAGRPQRAGLLTLLIVCLFPITVYPLFVRDLLYSSAKVLPSPQIKIPDYWRAAATALEGDRELSRVLLMPSNGFYSIPYVWGGYFADGLADRLLPKTALNQDFSYIAFNPGYSDLLDAVYTALEAPGALSDPTQALALLNVRYVLVRGDVGSGEYLPLGGPVPDPRSAGVNARLATLPGLTLHAAFGPLNYFRVKDEQFGPRFYVPEHAAEFSSAAAVVARPSSEPGLPVYLARADMEAGSVRQPEGCQARLNFEQVNPTRYRVQADGNCDAYWLVFSSGYDVNWQATIIPPTGPSVTVPNGRHVSANGYANAWRIEQSGPHTLVVEYQPQRVFIGAGLLSGATLLGVGLATLWAVLRQRPLHRAAVA